MTHDEVSAMLGHDHTVATYLVEEVLSGKRLPAPAGIAPVAQFAADTALLEARGLAVTAFASDFEHSFVARLDRGIALTTDALAGDPSALHRLHMGG